jgi:hypothetical protein
MPPLPPVITATRPLRSKMFWEVIFWEVIFWEVIFWEVMARFRFLIVWPALDGGQMFRPNHGQGRPKNQIWLGKFGSDAPLAQ